MPTDHGDEWREEIARDGDPHGVLEPAPSPLPAAPPARSKTPTVIAGGALALLLVLLAYKRGR